MGKLDKIVSSINKYMKENNDGSDLVSRTLGLGRGSKVLGSDDFIIPNLQKVESLP